jgi:hypothetical protein
MSTSIERETKARADTDAFVLAMFLLWASRPCDPEPDNTGAYFIGDVGSAPEQPTFERWSPYSLAEPKPKIEKGGQGKSTSKNQIRLIVPGQTDRYPKGGRMENTLTSYRFIRNSQIVLNWAVVRTVVNYFHLITICMAVLLFWKPFQAIGLYLLFLMLAISGTNTSFPRSLRQAAMFWLNLMTVKLTPLSDTPSWIAAQAQKNSLRPADEAMQSDRMEDTAMDLNQKRINMFDKVIHELCEKAEAAGIRAPFQIHFTNEQDGRKIFQTEVCRDNGPSSELTWKRNYPVNFNGRVIVNLKGELLLTRTLDTETNTEAATEAPAPKSLGAASAD